MASNGNRLNSAPAKVAARVCAAERPWEARGRSGPETGIAPSSEARPRSKGRAPGCSGVRTGFSSRRVQGAGRVGARVHARPRERGSGS
jgi:hypothetical protein